MNSFSKFFHELFYPHCPQCIKDNEDELDLKRDALVCNSCESLKSQLAVVNQQNLVLLNKIINPVETTSQVADTVERRPIQTRHIPWTVKKQQLEQSSRERVAALKNAVQPDSKIASLEKEMGITNGLETVNS